MKYNLIYKKSGVKIIKKILSIEAASTIIDFCCVKDGFFIVEETICYLINLNNEIIFEKDFGSNVIRAVCSCNNDIYALTRNNGEIINIITGQDWIRGNEKKKFAKQFENLKDYSGYIYCNNMHMVVSIEELNKCYIFDVNETYRVIGNGRREFSLSSDVLKSGISRPKGIVLFNNNLYISDYGNGCIRSFQNIDDDSTHKLLLGHPTNTNKHIKVNKLFIINKNLYYNSGDTIYQSSINNDNQVIYYKDDKIKNMSISYDGTKIITLVEC